MSSSAQHSHNVTRFGLLPGGRLDSLSLDIQAFMLDRQAQGMSAGTLRYYRDKLKLLKTFLHDVGVASAGEVTADLLRAYITWVGQDHNPGGTLLAFRAAATFFKWLEQEEVIDANPMRKLRAPKVPQRTIEPVSGTVLKALLSTCGKGSTGQRDRAMLLALLDTGCRAAEFLSLNVGDVDLERGAVIIRNGKGGKTRVTFLGARSRRELLRYLGRYPDIADEKPLWLSTRGNRLTASGLRRMMIRRATAAGVEAPSPHDFRRAFALASLRGGMDVYSLQRLMGHSDLTVLRRYLAQTQEDLQKAHEKAAPVDSLL